MKRSIMILAVAIGLLTVLPAMGVVVFDARYRVETVVAMQSAGRFSGQPLPLTACSAGRAACTRLLTRL